MSVTIMQTANQKTLTRSEERHVVELLEELDALIDCDDGTCFPLKVCERVEIVKEIMGMVAREEDEE
jgi:hypothetical protein